jgi:hypothetical protein
MSKLSFGKYDLTRCHGQKKEMRYAIVKEEKKRYIIVTISDYGNACAIFTTKEDVEKVFEKLKIDKKDYKIVVLDNVNIDNDATELYHLGK